MDRMGDHEYRFRSRWHVDAPPSAVYDVLNTLESYPRWWPQVRSVERIDDDRARLTIKSFLPYRLVFELSRETTDRQAGVLCGLMSGDLNGWSRWSIRPQGDGTALRFDELAVVTVPLLRRLAAAVRPALVTNHAWMMRCGRRGLEAAAAGAAIARAG